MPLVRVMDSSPSHCAGPRRRESDFRRLANQCASFAILVGISTPRPFCKCANVACTRRDGKDGSWSTFRIEVGNPPQQLRVLPASGQSTSWLVLQEACGVSADDKCAYNRGFTFNRNVSSTWDEYGSFSLLNFLENQVGLEGNGLYGFDTVTLGWTTDGLPTFDNLMVTGIVTEDFYVGGLGLNPRPTNFTDFNNPVPSLMQLLRDETNPRIPSTSWSYTSGAYNLSPKVFGSLVLGGYDVNRFEPNNVLFPLGSDISLEFQVAIQSIGTDIVGFPLLSRAIIAYIDTMVADIWLPTPSCNLFEEAFGLIWDEATDLYLLNNDLHQSLMEKNPTVTFQVGPEADGESVQIQLPYHNWYQTATPAYIGNSSGYYFPLRRASNSTQYILGRAFLQSAYISVDYDRNRFNVSQALYPSSKTPPTIFPIYSPGTGPMETTNSGEIHSQPSAGLSTGAIVGIVIGAVLALVFLVAAILYFRRRRKSAANKKDKETLELETGPGPNELACSTETIFAKHEFGDGLGHEAGGDSHHRVELAEQRRRAELNGESTEILEANGDTQHRVELEEQRQRAEIDGVRTQVFELSGDSAPKGAELAAGKVPPN